MKKIGFLLLFALLTVFSLEAAKTIKADSVPQTIDSDNYNSLDEDQRETLLVKKLSPEQLYELEKARSENDSFSSGPSPAGIVLISLMPFLTAVLIVFFVFRSKHQKEQRLFQLYEKALDAGKDLPDGFFKHPETEQKSHFLKGLIWIGVGAGISIGGFYLMGEHSPWGFGLIPVFVGLAYLISYFVEKRNNSESGSR